MADHHVGSLLEAVGSIHAGGGTNLSAGYLLALRDTRAALWVRRSPCGLCGHCILDGSANLGLGGQWHFRGKFTCHGPIGVGKTA